MIRRQPYLLFGFLLMLGCAGAPLTQAPPAESTPVDLPNPLRLTVTDELGTEALQRDYGPLQGALAQALGVTVELVPVDDQVSGVLLLKEGRVDLALVGPSEYVVIRARTNAVPVIGVTRPNYRSVLAVQANSAIESVADLRGKTLALSDVGSTSGHLGPIQMITAAGLDPQGDVTVRMLGDEGSMGALTANTVDAWGGSLTDYQAMVADNSEGFRVLQEGPPLPSDVFVANSQTSPEVVAALREQMLAEGAALTTAIAAREEKYRGSTFINTQDSDYDSIRNAYRAIGQGAFIEGGDESPAPPP